MKCDVNDGSIISGLRRPIFFSLVLNKPTGFKIFCDPGIIQYKKVNKIVMETTTFYFENDDHKEVTFIVEVVTFTLQMIKI